MKHHSFDMSSACKPSVISRTGRPDGAAVHYKRDRPEQTTLYRLVQQHTFRTDYRLEA
ncbi:MAG: hypothetical protein Q8R33_05450 [Burkholderiales bacterium]|nr:hypothetical protein [Burkholderiales bacterium]